MNILRHSATLVLFSCLTLTSVNAQPVLSWKVKDVVNYINTPDSIVVVSFWATFCKPCIEEIPYLESISEKYKDRKVKVLLVSLDLPEAFPAKIDSFLQTTHYSSQVVWLNETNADYFCPAIDKTWTGSIPSTYIVNTKKGYRKFIEEQMKPAQFEAELQKAL